MCFEMFLFGDKLLVVANKLWAVGCVLDGTRIVFCRLD